MEKGSNRRVVLPRRIDLDKSPPSNVDLLAEIRSLNDRAEALIASNPREALGLGKLALDKAVLLGFAETQAASLWVQGIALGHLEEVEQSDQFLNRSAKAAEDQGQVQIQFRSINGLGTNAHRRGEYGKAFAYYHQCLAYARKAGDRVAEGRALGNIGVLFSEMGELTRSLEIFQQSLAIGLELDESWLSVVSAMNIADGKLSQGECLEALEIIERWRPVAQREGLWVQDAMMLGSRGEAGLGLGRTEEACRDLEAAVSAARGLGDFHEICWLLILLGRGYLATGRDVEALTVLDEAFERCEKVKSLALQLKASRVLVGLHEAAGRIDQALRYAHTVMRVQEQLYAERLSRRTEVHAVEFELEQLRNQTEFERQKTESLQKSNTLLLHLQENLQHEVTHDSLTGLFNRRHFLEMLESILLASASRPTRLGIAYIDLDGFKTVNDTHGHQAGDALLVEIAQRLTQATRCEDVVARLGGDEFAIIFSSIRDGEDGETQVGRLGRAIIEPYLWNGVRRQCSAAIGIAMFPEHGQSAAELLHRADSEMYRHKRANLSSRCASPTAVTTEPSGTRDGVS